METNIHFWYLSLFFVQWEIFQMKVVEKTKNIFYAEYNFSFENRAVYEVTWAGIA
jgi:hypothetical protein